MKKMTKKDSTKVFTKARSSNPIIIKYPVGEETVEIKIETNLSIGDINDIVDDARYFANMDGNYYESNFEARVAYSIVKYLSNIPVPTIDGEKVDDVNACYQLFFGQNGLIKYSEELYDFVDMFRYYSKFKKDEYSETSVDELCAKLLSLYNIAAAELGSIKENPAELLKIIENLDEEK